MKRLFYLMLVVLGTAAFTACSDDDDNNNGDGNSNDGNGTITMVTEGQNVKLIIHTLNEGDKVTIDWGDGLTETYQSAQGKYYEDIYNIIDVERNYTGSNHMN